MQINFDQILKDLNGKEIYEMSLEFAFNKILKEYAQTDTISINELKRKIEEYKGEPIILKTIVVNALMAPSSQQQGQPQMSGEEKLKRYILATKINQGGVIDITMTEEAKLIKDVVDKAYNNPLIYGIVYNILEQKNVDKDVDKSSKQKEQNNDKQENQQTPT